MKKNSIKFNPVGNSTIIAVALVLLFIFTGCDSDEVYSDVETIQESQLKLSSKSVNLSISSVTADHSHSSYPASKAIDGVNTHASRWAGYGEENNFIMDLGSKAEIVDYVKIAFAGGNTRSYSFQVWTRETSSSSWIKVGTKTSSGTTTDYETFDVTNSSARYVRLKCYGSTASLWTNIKEVDVYGTPGTDSGGGSGYPADVLGISANTWKINSFVGSPSNDPTYYDDITDASGVSYNTYSDDNYFYTDGTWTYFKCYRGLGGSSNSDNPRVELRELDGSGGLEYWTNEGTNSMTWTVRVNQLSNDVNNSNGVTCVGQIHGPGDSVDDIIRVQFYGDAGQSSGSVRLKISGYLTEDVLGGSVFIDNGYQLDTEYTFKLEYNSDDYVTLYSDGSKIFSEKMDVDEDENYFKVGNYVQQSKGASYDGSYSLVAIKDLSVVHN